MTATSRSPRPRRAPPAATDPPAIVVREAELLDTATLRPHPRNYRGHPPAQLQHLDRSLREFGVYRNVVVAADRTTVLAGHGVWQAARDAGAAKLTAVVMPYGPTDPAALKLVVADNMLAELAEDDQAALVALVHDAAGGDPARLVGTGITADALAMMTARLDPALPDGFGELLPKPPPEPEVIECPICHHTFTRDDLR